LKNFTAARRQAPTVRTGGRACLPDEKAKAAPKKALAEKKSARFESRGEPPESRRLRRSLIIPNGKAACPGRGQLRQHDECGDR